MRISSLFHGKDKMRGRKTSRTRDPKGRMVRHSRGGLLNTVDSPTAAKWDSRTFAYALCRVRFEKET
jgi:hypothetical protein